MTTSSRIGRSVPGPSGGGERWAAYLPPPLPPVDPPLDMGALYPLLDAATTALGRLDGMAGTLPDLGLFLYMYIRKEAMLSSQIEGTQSSLTDLLLFEMDEAPGVPPDDAAEVLRYVRAMDYGLERLKTLPLSLRLLREIHAVLMTGAPRGGEKQPGAFRTSQNWIGGTRPGNAAFVPPPPHEVLPCMAALEDFLHGKGGHLPVLIRAALAHAQFETIHPFLDGNGRLGRLLITFMLCAEGLLSEPLLYLSLYLKTHRQVYYDHLQAVRTQGAWEAWVAFFLEGVAEVAQQATQTARDLTALCQEDQRRVRAQSAATAAFNIHAYLQRRPMTKIPEAADICGISYPTAMRGLTVLERLGIVREITGRPRHKVFVYEAYMDILKRGTEHA
jgi:Fic family protein